MQTEVQYIKAGDLTGKQLIEGRMAGTLKPWRVDVHGEHWYCIHAAIRGVPPQERAKHD